MKRILKWAFLLIAGGLCLPAGLKAQQQIPPVPTDKEVKIGTLDNGLTYYIRHNEFPKNQVDFYIAQKVGCILEEDNQRGLAHFLEHMCFNGTEHFPGNTLIPWLESVGVKFGQNLNAYTSIDETVYRISSVPTERIGVQDTCLLILRDWADGLLLEPKAIDEERSVIHEEWRSQTPPNQRIMEKILPTLYPDSRYGHRLPIGIMSVVDNFPHQALRDYYEKWYRPDLQGIIVVGDIDVDRIEAKIKELFASIEKPVQPAERVYYPVADNQEPIIAIGTDKEQPNSVVQLMFKYDALPDSLRGSMAYLTTEYMLNMADMMVSQRLHELSQKPEAKFGVAGTQHGNFLVASTKKSVIYFALPKNDNVSEALGAIYREALRAKRGGFTATEYARCRSEYLSQLEKAYNNRNQQENKKLAESYVRGFLDKTPIPGIETEYQLMNVLANQIPVEAINQLYAQLVSDNNIAIVAMMPEREDISVPTADELGQMLKQVSAEDIAPYVDNVKDEPLISQLPQAGKVVKEADRPEFGAKEWTLSNGVKVIWKKTDFKADEITFQASAKGGTSVYSDEYTKDLTFMPLILMQHGVGNFTYADLNKALAGKQVAVNIELSDYTRNLSGNTTPKDLKTLMELIYMNFTALNITADEFTAQQNLYKGILQNQGLNPQFIFQKKLQEYLYASPRNYIPEAKDIEQASRENILRIVREQLANAADFTFAFSGNIDEQELRTLAKQYLATLPSDPTRKAEIKRISGLGIRAGKEQKEFFQPMEVPQGSAAVMVSAQMPYSFKNRILASMTAQLISTKLLSEVREKEGAVYSIYTQSVLNRFSDVPLVYETNFQVKPEKKDRALEIIRNEFNQLAQRTDETELNKIKEFMVKTIAEQEHKNSYWCSEMADHALLPTEVCTNAEALIQSITPQEISAFMQEVMKQGNYRVLIMMPESKQ